MKAVGDYHTGLRRINGNWPVRRCGRLASKGSTLKLVEEIEQFASDEPHEPPPPPGVA